MPRESTILRIHRTTADLPDHPAKPGHRIIKPYNPWICVACGHPHHGMTRHHRLPVRVAWKIPRAVWEPILGGPVNRVVPLCGPCHHFIETGKKGPCAERPDHRYALLSWKLLREEIELFDKIVAYYRTEAVIRQCKEELAALSTERT